MSPLPTHTVARQSQRCMTLTRQMDCVYIHLISISKTQTALKLRYGLTLRRRSMLACTAS